MNKCTNELCEKYLNILYQCPSSDFIPSTIAETSGEILYGSINKLIPFMRLTENDIFVDLGSAKGKIISQMFLTTPIKAAIGIEIVPDLHKTAMTISERIRGELPQFYENDRSMSFICGDFLKIPLDKMTIAIINATCFPASLVDELGEVVNNTSSIRCVLSLRPLIRLKRLALKHVIPIECSWDSTLCYCYE